MKTSKPIAAPASLRKEAESPAFARPLHVGQPNTGNVEDFLARVRDIFDRRWFTNNGHYVQEFEKRLQAYLGVKHCIAVCNATVGLEIASRALGFKGEVIVPSFTFVATPHALSWQGITPVFCDVDPRTHNLDPAKVEALITPKTTGILAVHVWGRPCDTEALAAIARRRGLGLLFDAAHAFGCSDRDRMIGNFGDAEVFSFHATKFFNTFEGGAIATHDDALAKKIRLMKNFGFAGADTVIHEGINGKMSEISAAMGLTSFESMEHVIAKNFENYQAYQAAFAGIPGLTLVRYDERVKNNYQYIVAEVQSGAAGFDRDALVRFLQAQNVLVRRYFYPGCHQMEPYRTNFPGAGALLPETENLCSRVVAFPNGTAIGVEDIRRIGALIAKFRELPRTP